MNRSDAEKLMPQYFRGELSSAERDDFIQAVLQDQDLYNVFAEEQLLRQLVNDPEFRARLNAAVLPGVGRGRKLMQIFGSRPARWRFALVALALILVVSPFLLINRFVGTAPTKLPSITLLLMPVERGSSSSAILRLPPQTQVVVLTAQVNGDWSGTYSAVLEGPGGGEMTWKGLRPKSQAQQSQEVTLRFNSNLLTPGNYALTLYASEDGSRSNPVASYLFSVAANSR